MILIGFTCTGTFQLWLNCAQNFAKENVGWANPSIMQTYYSAGTMLALVVTAFLTRKIKDVRFIVVYPAIWCRRTASDRNFRLQHAVPENQRNRNRTGYDRIFSLQLHHPDRSI